MYDLQEQLSKVEQSMIEDPWERAYLEYFPELQSIKSVRHMSKWNRQSITKRIKLSNDKVINISEKIRYRNRYTGRIYEDIALEYVSVDTQSTPGWICKPTNIDYLVYIIEPLNICHIFPMQELQVCWRRHNREWFKYYPDISASNETYSTRSLCIPISVLKEALLSIQTYKYL